MGLDTSHDCWHGAYSAFHRFRQNLAAAIGIDLLKMASFVPDGIAWPSKKDEPLVSLLNHSDCDGSIPVKELIPLANRLDEVANIIEQGPPPNDCSGFSMTATSLEVTGGHLMRNGGTAESARIFAKGCRLAASQRQVVRFH